MVLDDTSIDTSGWNPVPGFDTLLVSKTIQISPGYHRVYHESQCPGFAATVFGEGGQNCGFAYPAGMCYSDMEYVSTPNLITNVNVLIPYILQL